jgi:hypothetical protein
MDNRYGNWDRNILLVINSLDHVSMGSDRKCMVIVIVYLLYRIN